MRGGEVGDMDVVADRGAVGRVVVVAEHGEVDVTLQRHHGARNEVGLVVTQFADPAGRVGAARIEVAQAERAEAIG